MAKLRTCHSLGGTVGTNNSRWKRYGICRHPEGRIGRILLATDLISMIAVIIIMIVVMMVCVSFEFALSLILAGYRF
jgi:hypothetical protein